MNQKSVVGRPHNDPHPDLSPEILRARKAWIASGETLEQLAVRSGISRDTLAKVFSGVRPDPGLSTARAVLRAVGLDLAVVDPDG